MWRWINAILLHGSVWQASGRHPDPDPVGSATWRYRARVRVRAPASAITGRLPPAVVVEAVDEYTCIINVGSDTPQMLVVYLGMLDADFEVVEPPELLEQLQTLADRYRRAIARTDLGESQATADSAT
jgi:hypothetical protein